MIIHLIMAKLREQAYRQQHTPTSKTTPKPTEKTWTAWCPSPKHPSALVKITPKKTGR
jgi:hypothetical protein